MLSATLCAQSSADDCQDVGLGCHHQCVIQIVPPMFSLFPFVSIVAFMIVMLPMVVQG